MSAPLPASPKPRALSPRNRLGGKYLLKRRIAVGGMGEIWVAQNQATSADVALKVLRRDTDKRTQAEARFRHEARLSATLSHRSIIKIFNLVEEPDGTLILVMELLRGETLHAFLERNGPRPAREAVAILSPILSALAHAHDLGIVHRDVTPANIFLSVDPDGQVTPKLLDFGIAKVAASDSYASQKRLPMELPIVVRGVPTSGVKTIDGRVLGTPRYMSPEQVRMRSDIDLRSDLFSVGAVLFEIMTGASPFAADTAEASLKAVIDATIDPDSRIDPKVWLEIQRALSKRAYERHGNAPELALALRAAVEETEGSLAALLARTAPPLRRDEEIGDDPPPVLPEFQTKSIEGTSVVVDLQSRRARLAAIVSGFAIAAVLVVVWFLIRPPWSEAASGTSPAVGPPAPTLTVHVPSLSTAPTASPSIAPSATSPAATAPSNAPPAHAVIARPSTTTKPKPIATTPGF